MRPRIALGALLLLAALPAAAADWGLLVPAKTTQPQARERFGAPTRAEVVKVEGFDTDRWTYDGAQAPPGVLRLVLEFGLKDDRGYRREVLRAFSMEPKTGVFHKGILAKGWGDPDRVGREGQTEIFVWASGLIAYFDNPEALDPRLLLFGIPQQLPPPVAPPR
ncbi:MAG: hypothetical protein ACRELS_08845 [Candidatus Rokuibacteriota bacterium]